MSDGRRTRTHLCEKQTETAPTTAKVEDRQSLTLLALAALALDAVACFRRAYAVQSDT